MTASTLIQALKESTRAFLREKTGNYTAPEPRRRSEGFRRLAPALACAALLVVGLSGYQAYFTPTSAISIDINPSVELEINRFDRVITVEGLNDDGTALAAELNVRFLSYDDALEQIIASDAIQQCLADDGVLSIVVSGDNEVQQQEILSCAQRCTSGESNAHCYAGSSEDLAEAQALGLPLGKYHAYEELHALIRALRGGGRRHDHAGAPGTGSMPARTAMKRSPMEAEAVSISMEAAGTSMNRVKTAGAMLRLLLFWQKKGTNRPGWAVGPHGAVRPDSKGMVTGSKPAVRHRFRRRSSCSQHCGLPLWHIHW